MPELPPIPNLHPQPDFQLRERLVAIAAGIPLRIEGKSFDLLALAHEIQAARRHALLQHIAEAIARQRPD